MPQTSRRTRRERRIKRQNTLLYRGLIHQTKQLNIANSLLRNMVNAADAPAPIEPVPAPADADTVPDQPTVPVPAEPVIDWPATYSQVPA